MKSASKNMILAVIARVVTIITGVIVQRYILISFGSVLNGLTSSITQVMSYLVLLEAGLGSASIQALYYPLAQNEWRKISRIITATGKEYKKISAIFTACLLVISVILPLSTIEEVDYSVAALLTLITGGSSVASYIFGGKYKALLNADRKVYILYYFDIATILLSCILRVFALQAGKGIVFVQFLNLLTVGFKNIAYLLYVKSKYKFIDYKAEPDERAISKRWNVLIHSIAGIVVNHTDIVILTLFASLKTVSLYSVYNMVFGQMSNMIQMVFTQAPQASFGRLYNQDKEKFTKIYLAYESIFTALLCVLVSISLVMILPFVKIYTAGINDITYIDWRLQVLFALILLMSQLRAPAIIAINVTGYFKETQNGAIIEAIINIVVSLFLFFAVDMGIYGLLIGTVISYIYRTTDVIIFVYKKILQKKLKKYVSMLVTNLLGVMLIAFVFIIKLPVDVENFSMWVVKACVIGIITCAVFFLGNYWGNRKNVMLAFSYVKKTIF